MCKYKVAFSGPEFSLCNRSPMVATYLHVRYKLLFIDLLMTTYWMKMIYIGKDLHPLIERTDRPKQVSISNL